MKLIRSIICLLLCAFMCSGYAASTAIAFTYQQPDGTLTFEKITHPDKPVAEADGIVDYVGNGVVSAEDLGQGARGQSYSWCAAGRGDYVYIGTCYGAATNTLDLMSNVLGGNFDQETLVATLNVLYNGTFFTGEEDGANPGGILAKVNTVTNEVTILMSKSTDGHNPLFRNATAYNGRFYFCGSVDGLPCIYELDPETDELVMVYQGMTLQDFYEGYLEGICTGIRGLCEFDGELILSCVTKDGPVILSSSEPREGFTVIADQHDLFDYPAYHFCDSIYGGSIWEMTEFNGSLYVSICTGTPENMPDDNTMQSFALVRGDKDENGEWIWTSIIGDQERDGARYTFGIDPERTRSGAGVIQVYNGYLYIGEYNDEEVALEDLLLETSFDFFNENLRQSVNLYRMDADENIELVVGDPTEMFPDGGISGIGSGFGRNENQYIWRMTEYEGKLYLGTFDTSSLLEPIGQFANGDINNMTPKNGRVLSASSASLSSCASAAAVTKAPEAAIPRPWISSLPITMMRLSHMCLGPGIFPCSASAHAALTLIPIWFVPTCSTKPTPFPSAIFPTLSSFSAVSTALWIPCAEPSPARVISRMLLAASICTSPRTASILKPSPLTASAIPTTMDCAYLPRPTAASPSAPRTPSSALRYG